MEKKHPYNSDLLQEKIGYHFNNKALLKNALTHSSYSNELKAKGIKEECNERLEFLGDSILSILVSEYLFTRFASKMEGDLSKIRAAVVCEKALDKYAADIKLGEYLYLGHGEEMNNGRERPSIIADAFEALLASMYLDSDHNMEVVRQFLMPKVIAEIDTVVEGVAFEDYKTTLQQVVQQAEGEVLEYVLIDEYGPDHNKTFVMEAHLNSNVIGRGKARSKREAEQLAAKEALELFVKKK